MLSKTIILLALASLAYAHLQSPFQTVQFQPEQFYANGKAAPEPAKKFHNLSEAIAESEKVIVSIKDNLNLPSLVFGISVRGKTIWNKSWGFADLENGVKATLDTTYRLASVSKTFTSVVIGTLVDQGLIKYTDSLSVYVKAKDYPSKSWHGKQVAITIGQLLSHTAGEHVSLVTDFVNNLSMGVNCTQMIHTFKNEPLLFEPGTSYNYSNYGFQLLGAVIESVTKKPYQQVLNEFFVKHKLHSSHVETQDLMIHNRASYYQPANVSAYKVNIRSHLWDELFISSGWWAAGGLMSNVPDLIRYGNLIIDSYKGRKGAILSQKTLKEMWTSRTSHFSRNNTHFPPGTNYGYGWVISDLDAPIAHKHFVWHNGGLTGISTILIVYPDEEVVGVALTNKGSALGLDQMVVYTMENIYDFVPK